MKRSFTFRLAETADVADLAALHRAVSRDLGKDFEKFVLIGMRNGKVYVARLGDQIVGTLWLTTKKPWAIDKSYFAKSQKPLYLLAMAVLPDKQKQGLGRRCLEEAAKVAREWPADAIRLDAYDAEFGAGGFYAKCGYTEVGRATYRGTPLIYYELLLSY
jgi:GNAT superfamily N-acetyltransferase